VVAEITRGTCFPIFAFDVAQSIDLDGAERRVASGVERQTVKQKRRAPAYFEYEPAPLRVIRQAEPVTVGACRTNPTIELVVYDFGAISASYAIPINGPLSALPALSYALWGNDALRADARRHVESFIMELADVAIRPRLADFVEDYAIFQIERIEEVGGRAPLSATSLWSDHAQVVAQTLRAEPRTLSEQELADALGLRLSFGPDDATIIDTDAALLVDRDADDLRAVLEFANTQLVELRHLDQQLDVALDRSYEVLARSGLRLGFLGRYDRNLRWLARLQLDGAILFQQLSTAVKLVGEQYLARVYSLASRRFHVAEWDASITRKLATLDGVYAKMADRAASRRLEVLEWIIVVLVALEVVLSIGVPRR
jgi:hypothetical protein